MTIELLTENNGLVDHKFDWTIAEVISISSTVKILLHLFVERECPQKRTLRCDRLQQGINIRRQFSEQGRKIGDWEEIFGSGLALVYSLDIGFIKMGQILACVSKAGKLILSGFTKIMAMIFREIIDKHVARHTLIDANSSSTGQEKKAGKSAKNWVIIVGVKTKEGITKTDLHHLSMLADEEGKPVGGSAGKMNNPRIAV